MGVVAVSHDDVRKIAALARLAVPAERLDALVGELNGILAHMDVLNAVDVSDVHADDTQSSGSMRLAPDVGPSVSLVHGPPEFAPAWRDGFFIVPRLDTHGELGAATGDDAG